MLNPKIVPDFPHSYSYKVLDYLIISVVSEQVKTKKGKLYNENKSSLKITKNSLCQNIYGHKFLF
jgi:hypothetical protein